MTPYLVLAATVAILASLGDFLYREGAARRKRAGEAVPKPRLYSSYFDILAAGALVAFAGFRYEVGTDYGNYVSIFNALNTSDWAGEIAASPQEFGFTALMLAAKELTGTPLTVFWVVAVLTVVPTYAMLKRYSSWPAFSVALFVLLTYVWSFNVIRQGASVALLFWAWSFLGRKNRWFVVIAVLAASMHVSAVFAAVALVVARKWRFTPRTLITITVAAVGIALLAERTPIIAEVTGRFNPRYAAYLESEQTGLGSYLMIAAFVALLGFAVLINSRNNPLTDEDHQYAVYLFIGIAFMVVGTQAGIVFRMAFYFLPFALLLIPNRLAGSQDRTVAWLFVLAGSTGYYIAHLANYGDVLPYQTYLGIP